MGVVDIKLDKEKLGDLSKLNIFYNGNLESKLLLKALEDLLEKTNTKVIAYTYKREGRYLPDMQLFLVDKDYNKPYFRKDIDVKEVYYISNEFSNGRSRGVGSKQYTILTDIYNTLISKVLLSYEGLEDTIIYTKRKEGYSREG